MLLERMLALSLLLCLAHLQHVSGTWMESVVEISFDAPLEHAYNLYKELDEHPTWSPWLKKVVFNRQTGESSWTLSSLGLTFSWDAVSVETYEPYVVQWKSTTGLPNTGRVEFSSNLVVCRMELSDEIEDSESGNAGLRYCGPVSDLTIDPSLATLIDENGDIIEGSPAAAENSKDVESRNSKGDIAVPHALNTDAFKAVDSKESYSTQRAEPPDERVHMKVIVRYDLPDIAARVLKFMGPIGRSFIYGTIHGDLERFRDRVQREVKELATSSSSSTAETTEA